MKTKKLVGFSEALENPTLEYEIINKKTGRRLLQATFDEILKNLHSHISDINFIKFFDEVEIYKIVEIDYNK